MTLDGASESLPRLIRGVVRQRTVDSHGLKECEHVNALSRTATPCRSIACMAVSSLGLDSGPLLAAQLRVRAGVLVKEKMKYIKQTVDLLTGSVRCLVFVDVMDVFGYDIEEVSDFWNERCYDLHIAIVDGQDVTCAELVARYLGAGMSRGAAEQAFRDATLTNWVRPVSTLWLMDTRTRLLAAELADLAAEWQVGL